LSPPLPKRGRSRPRPGPGRGHARPPGGAPMTTARSRIIHTRASARQVPDLLQAVFTAELLCPSPCLWLVSPWVSDIPVLDNRTNGFLPFEPRWARTQVSLSQALGKLLELGTTIHV